MSVLAGWYISPYAQALFTRNTEVIDGLLMDATWKIIPNGVSSILMLSISNVGIPVALAIGRKEDRAHYETFHTVLHEVLGIGLQGWKVVSDQGTALRSVCRQHRNEQFLCLRHFLVSLTRNVWSEEIGNLIRCGVSQDFDCLCAEYEPRFLQALEAGSGSPVAKRLRKLLANVGLGLISGHVAVVDGVKWGRSR
jgi:hypothetical protein